MLEWNGVEGRKEGGRGREALEEKASQGAGAWDFFSLTEMKQALEYAWGESGKNIYRKNWVGTMSM